MVENKDKEIAEAIIAVFLIIFGIGIKDEFPQCGFILIFLSVMWLPITLMKILNQKPKRLFNHDELIRNAIKKSEEKQYEQSKKQEPAYQNLQLPSQKSETWKPKLWDPNEEPEKPTQKFNSQQNYKPKRQTLITRPEQKFYWHLKDVFPNHHIFCQVTLNQVVEVTREFGFNYNKIREKSLDYVVCDGDMKVLCAIELDGVTHTYGKQIHRDEVKNSVLEDAGILLIRVTGSYPNKAEFKSLLQH